MFLSLVDIPTAQRHQFIHFNNCSIRERRKIWSVWKISELTAVMDQDMKSARVNPGVAPGSGVYLGLEQGEIEALHVALAAGVAQRLEIPAVPHLVLVRRFLRQVLAAASRRSQRHPRAKLFLGERSLAFPFSLSRNLSPGAKIFFASGKFYSPGAARFIAADDCRCLPAFDSETESTRWRRGFVRRVRKWAEAYRRHSPPFFLFSRHSFHGRSPSLTAAIF